MRLKPHTLYTRGFSKCHYFSFTGALDALPSPATLNPAISVPRRQSQTEDCGWFDLCDLTEGQSLFKILPTPLPSAAPLNGLQMQVNQSTFTHEPVQSEDGTEQFCNATDHNQSGFSIRLSHGIQFQTGRLVWSLMALPQDQVLTIKVFCAARDGRLDDLRNIIDSSQCAVHPMPFIFVTPPTADHSLFHPTQYGFSTLSIVTEEGIDINTEYRPPTSDDSFLHQYLSTALSPSSAAVPPRHPSPYLLLHIAVVNNDLDMVLFLLDKGADVSQYYTPHTQVGGPGYEANMYIVYTWKVLCVAEHLHYNHRQ